MKLYFDQRQAEKINVFVYFDDDYYGKVVATKGDVTGIEVPTNIQKVRLSFTDIFDGSDELPDIKLEKEVAKDIPMTEAVLDKIKRKWQYAYDVEVDLTLYEEDLLFYPLNFKEKALEGGIYYRGRGLSTGLSIEQRLIKRVESFGIEDYRKKRIIMLSILAVVLLINFPLSANFYFNEYLPNLDYWEPRTLDRFGPLKFLEIIFSFFGFLLTVIEIRYAVTYDDIYRENEMKLEYHLNADEYV